MSFIDILVLLGVISSAGMVILIGVMIYLPFRIKRVLNKLEKTTSELIYYKGSTAVNNLNKK